MNSNQQSPNVPAAHATTTAPHASVQMPRSQGRAPSAALQAKTIGPVIVPGVQLQQGSPDGQLSADERIYDGQKYKAVAPGTFKFSVEQAREAHWILQCSDCGDPTRYRVLQRHREQCPRSMRPGNVLAGPSTDKNGHHWLRPVGNKPQGTSRDPLDYGWEISGPTERDGCMVVNPKDIAGIPVNQRASKGWEVQCPNCGILKTTRKIMAHQRSAECNRAKEEAETAQKGPVLGYADPSGWTWFIKAMPRGMTLAESVAHEEHLQASIARIKRGFAAREHGLPAHLRHGAQYGSPMN